MNLLLFSVVNSIVIAIMVKKILFNYGDIR